MFRPKLFRSKEVVKNGNVISLEYQSFQVDLIVVSEEKFEATKFYLGNADMGMILGNICSMLTCGKSKCDCCDLVDDETGIFKPISKRGCTDVLCLAIFLVYFFAMIAIGAVSAGAARALSGLRRVDMEVDPLQR